MKVTIKAKLLTVEEGIYTRYVFENVNEPDTSLQKYVMVTKCPNWQTRGHINIDDIGFLEYEIAEAGATYFNSRLMDYNIYRYDNCYFMDFIKIKENKESKEYIF